MDDVTPEVRSFLSSTAFRGATGARVRSLSFVNQPYSKEYPHGQVENLDTNYTLNDMDLDENFNSDEDMGGGDEEGDENEENEHREEGEDELELRNDDQDDAGDEMTLDLLEQVPGLV